jgi:hypothetical protein
MADKLIDIGFGLILVVLIVYMALHAMWFDDREDKPWPRTLDEPEYEDFEDDEDAAAS